MVGVRTQRAAADAAAVQRLPWGGRSPGALHSQRCLRRDRQHITPAQRRWAPGGEGLVGRREPAQGFGAGEAAASQAEA